MKTNNYLILKRYYYKTEMKQDKSNRNTYRENLQIISNVQKIVNNKELLI